MNSDEKFVRLMTEEEEKIFMAKGLKAEGIKEGIQQGIHQGIEQGIHQGELTERTNVIKKLIQKGLSKEEISDTLEIPLSEINRLLKNQ